MYQKKFESRSAFLQATSGCTYETTIWQPVARRGSLAVVLGHGFLRNQNHMRGLAEAIAASGYAVATLDFCNMKLWDGHHRRNAAEMIATAAYWGFDNVLYAGFSAGALAALVAAADDDNTRGLILLDFVNRAPIGEDALSTLRAPVYALIAEPAFCNAHGNGVPLLDAIPNSQIEKISDASHCAFESPSNWLCHSLCASDISTDQIARQQIIQGVVDAIKRISQTGTFIKSATSPPKIN